MPTCYWLGHCGHWTNPSQWLKVAFWLGEPLQRNGEYLSWSSGKPYADNLRAVIRDEQLAVIEPCKSD